ncbi:T6SS phospholipase effector Tle1-like catalytic domain-containing protein, partial [Marinobacter halodurans]
TRLAASCLNSGVKERRFLVIRHLVYGGDLTTYVGVRNHWTTTVCGISDGPPFSPVVSWDDNEAGQGRWNINASEANFALGHSVQILNDSGITSQELSRRDGRGVGFLSASSLGTELMSRRQETERQRESVSPQSPFPAKQVEPLSSSVRATETTTLEKEPETHLEIGLFTDGTLNNADNSQTYRDQIKEECLAPFERGEISQAECEYRLGLALGTSYTNAPSNVAKLADLYIESRKVEGDKVTQRLVEYAPGIGTETGDGDSLEGMSTGLGDTGILSQVDDAFLRVAQRIYRLELKSTIASLSFDLFGFSRGAAAARHAAHEINRGPEGSLGKALKAMGIDWPRQVVIRFVGLFDSVAAVVSAKRGDLSPSNDRNDPVKIYLDPGKVEQAVHLVASDERRKNFALNSLRNPDATLPDNYREIALPGVHSDVGGGYPNSMREDVLLTPLQHVSLSWFENAEDTPQWHALEALKKQKDAEGWIGVNCLPVRSSERPNPSPSELGPESEASLEIYHHIDPGRAPHGSRDAELALRMVRQMRGEYSRVTLKLMHQLAVQADVPLRSIDPTNDAYRLPDELAPVAENLSEQILAGAASASLSMSQESLLRQRYIHYSADYSPIKFLALGEPAALELPEVVCPYAPTESGERIVYPNH